jgi:hypothetical protein
MAEEESKNSEFSVAEQTTRFLRSTLFWVATQAESLGISSWISRLLKLGKTVCLETSVNNCHYTLRDDPEQRRSQLLGVGSLNSGTLHEI